MSLPDSPRLRFRELTPDDLADVSSVLMEDDVMQRMHPLIAEELVRRWLARRMEQYRTPGHSHWHVSLKATGEFVGIVGIVPAKVEDVGYIGLGYHIKKEFRRCGYAFEGAQTCIDWAFRELRTDKIIAEVDEINLPSRYLAEKLGMVCERSFLRFNGETEIPHCLYVLPRSNFCPKSAMESY